MKFFRGKDKPKPNADRKTMEAALKEHCIPVLRDRGFKGSFPHFYRDTDNHISLVNFQFWSAGGSFCVNLGYADPQRKNVFFEPDTEVKSLKVMQTSGQCRLGATDGGDKWFHFGKTSYEEFRDTPSMVDEIALACSQFLALEAEVWWQNKQAT